MKIDLFRNALWEIKLMLNQDSSQEGKAGSFALRASNRSSAKKASLMGRPTRLKALVVKEFLQMWQDPSSLLIGIGLPLLLMFTYGYGVSLDLNHLRIGLVLQDNSPQANSFAEALTFSPYFDVTLARDPRELADDLTSGKIRGYVVIPSYFTKWLHSSSKKAPIQVIADGSETNTANFVQNYVLGAWQNWLKIQRITERSKQLSLVEALPRFWYNEQLESRNFLLPGSIAIIMTLIGTLLTALVISREWERGTMEALMSTPVSIVEILIGKLIPYFLLGMCSMIMCFCITVFYYGVPFRGSFWLLCLVTATFLMVSLGIGLFISTSARNQFAASQAALTAAFYPAFMLSGFIFEINSMPLPIRFITNFLPPRYYVSSLQTLFMVGDVWSLLSYNMLIMSLMSLVVFLATARRTVKRLD